VVVDPPEHPPPNAPACSPGASRDCPALVLAKHRARGLAHQRESAKSTLMEVEAAAVPKVSSPRAHGAHPFGSFDENPWRRLLFELLVDAACAAWVVAITLHVLGVGPRACP
jgi:hypothetical protein